MEFAEIEIAALELLEVVDVTNPELCAEESELVDEAVELVDRITLEVEEIKIELDELEGDTKLDVANLRVLDELDEATIELELEVDIRLDDEAIELLLDELGDAIEELVTVTALAEAMAARTLESTQDVEDVL